MGRYKTKKEATEAWVAEFNAIPLSMLQRLVDIDIDEWQIHYSEDEDGAHSLPGEQYGASEIRWTTTGWKKKMA